MSHRTNPQDYVNQATITEIALRAVIADLEMLKTCEIGGRANLELFEAMIDTLLDNPLIVAAVRMKQNPQDY